MTKDLTRIALNLTTNFPTIETPSLRSVEIFQDLEPIKRALKVVMQHEDSLRLVAERLSAFEIARNNSLDALRVPDISALSAIMAGINERFYIPKIQEVTRLFDALSSSHYADVISRFGQRNTVVEQAMSAMHFPWLDKNEPLRSFAGFAEIQSMGNALKSFSAYGDQLTDAIRASLGDWRQPISWNPTIFFDPINRAEFYLERGFDPALTNFPVEAFEESIEIAGFRSEPPSIVEEYGEPFPPLSDDVEAEGFKRNRLAFEWITRLEMNLRKFIDQVMTDAFGMDWAKHRLPNGLYDNWVSKREKERTAGRTPLVLIAYADFTDYEKIICRKDNWKSVFMPIFHRPESVRESLQRLYPIRVATMHSRIITREDQLYLFAETRRLICAFN